MGVFKSVKTISASPAMIPMMAKDIETIMTNEGFQVKTEELISGGYDISITKGGLFKAVLGMKTALKVNIVPQGKWVVVEAGIGIFGQQAIPTIISMFFLWPVLLTQIWGMVKQARLDDRVIEIAEQTAERNKSTERLEKESRFCTKCGSQVTIEARYCSNCGSEL